MEEDWIPWNGGECPVAPETLVQVRVRHGKEHSALPARYWTEPGGAASNWLHEDQCGADIIAYRVVQPAPAASPPPAADNALRAKAHALVDAVQSVLLWRVGELPDKGYIRDNNPSRDAIGKMVEALASTRAALSLSSSALAGEEGIECHGLDTPERVCFYEQDFYVLSNFSSFTVVWEGLRFDTSEALYHWLKFATTKNGVGLGLAPLIAREILNAPSAHEAFKIAQANKDQRRSDWDDVKLDFMRRILREKAVQHEYVMRKLLATGDRELVENSWRDDFWGWGPNRDGQNMLGKLWMEVRAELRTLPQAPKP